MRNIIFSEENRYVGELKQSYNHFLTTVLSDFFPITVYTSRPSEKSMNFLIDHSLILQIFTDEVVCLCTLCKIFTFYMYMNNFIA